MGSWEQLCDKTLLQHLLKKTGQFKKSPTLPFFFLSIFFMIIANTGPSWHQLPTPTYQTVQAQVLLLDLSEQMMETDLKPNRLTRARFQLHDLLNQTGKGQFGLIVYTGEPFVIAPLTDDGQTITALLPSLNPNIMPIGGNELSSALNEAQKLIHDAGYEKGQILILTAEAPSEDAINKAGQLAQEGIESSIMPMSPQADLNPLFLQLSQAGHGQLLSYNANTDELKQWLNSHKNKASFALNQQDLIPLQQDEGRWFLIPALILLLPFFRRAALLRVNR